jgi:uncharacterized protein (TIGR02266 family)
MGDDSRRADDEHAGVATITALEAPADNRRAHPRFRVELEVTFASEHNFYAGLVENLSAGGVFVATHQLKRVGDILELNLKLPGHDAPFVCKGEVRWLRPYNEHSDAQPGMGVRFVEIDPATSAAIERFVRGREPLLYDDDG